MYSFHLRSRTVLYLFAAAFLVYLWSYFSSLSDISLLSQRRSPHVNFKHLLIASIIAAQKGGLEVRQARSSKLAVSVKGKTKEGVLDVLTTGDRNSNHVMVNSLLYTFPGIRVISEEHMPTSGGGGIDVAPISVNRAVLNSAAFATIPPEIDLNLEDLVVWIDPLDATKEYSEGLTQYVTTMVCVVQRGEPLLGVIHQPFLMKTYWASKFGIDKKLLALRSTFMRQSADGDADRRPPRLVISRSHKGDVERLVHAALPNATVLEAAGSGFKTLELMKGQADIYLHKTHIKKWDVCAPNAILKYATEGTMSTLRGGSISYDFESDFVVREGIFATAKPGLVSLRQRLAAQLFNSRRLDDV